MIYLNPSSVEFSSSLAGHKPERLWRSFQQIIPARKKEIAILEQDFVISKLTLHE